MKKQSIRIGFLAAALTVAAGAISPGWTQLSDAPWPKYQHDLANSGRSPNPGPAALNHVKWEYVALSPIKPQVVVSHDGFVYLSHSREVVVKVNAANGQEVWTTGLGGFANQSTPVIGNGTTPTSTNYKIYRGERNNKFWSFETNGVKTAPDRAPTAWRDPDWFLPGWPYKIKFDGDVFGSSSISPERITYTTCGCLSNGLLHAFKVDGTQKWPALKLGVSGNRNSSPALSIDTGATPNVTRIFVGSTDGYLRRVDDPFNASAPTQVWEQRFGTTMRNSSPSLDGNRIYIGSDKGIASYTLAGVERWKLLDPTVIGEFDTTPAVDAGGVTGFIYASSYKTKVRRLYRIKKDGSEVTQLASGQSKATNQFLQSPSPVIDGSGNVYFPLGPFVKRYNSAGTFLDQFEVPTGHHVVTIALGNGVLYVTTRNNFLYAVGN